MDTWTYAGTRDDLREGEMCAVRVGAGPDSVDVLLCNIDGTVLAYEDRCPHLANPLSRGVLADGVLTCAAHEWEFDARTGHGVNPRERIPAVLPRAHGRRPDPRRRLQRTVSTDAAGVGPVLHTTPFARAVVAVIEDENEHVLVRDEGAYLRVLAPRVCRLSRAGLAAATDPAMRFPGDLEVVMSSFTGVLRLTEDAAVWLLAEEVVR